MLVLSSRLNEKIILPEAETTIEVVAVQSGTVRLGIQAPEHVRILREGVPDRVAEWGPTPDQADAPTLLRINQLLEKRLEIARQGLTELRRQLRDGETGDAEDILDKVDEDLHMLRRRLSREVAKVAALAPNAGCEPACCR
jgi:carbon storage regulator CsrA